MSGLVPAEQIEGIVGVPRHPERHYGRAVSADRRVYILHSQDCLDSGIDLRDCPYSLALDLGIDAEQAWRDRQDVPVVLSLWGDLLVPLTDHPDPEGGDE